MKETSTRRMRGIDERKKEPYYWKKLKNNLI